MAVTRSDSGPISRLLRRAGLDPRHVRNEIRKEIGTGDGKLGQVLPLTPRCEIVLALTIFLAERDESTEGEVDEAHLLMAILQEGESVPVRKLIEMGFDLNLWLQRLLLEISSPPDGALAEDFRSDHDMFDFPRISDDLDDFENVGSDSEISSPFAKGEM